jgi:uncharacterized membrane protein
MRNQYNNLFTCIMDYLYGLCMIFIVLSYVLCMTLMVFTYAYYELFLCTNLVDVISLFFTVFSFHLLIFDKNRSVSSKIRPEIATLIFRKNGQFIGEITDLLVKLAAF